MEKTTFNSVILYDGRNHRQNDMSVVVNGTKILRVEKTATLGPQQGRSIDLAGKCMMPGMTVGHWHGEYKDIGPPTFSSGRGGTFLGTEKPPAILALQAAGAMSTALLSGVTQLISGGCSNNLDSQMKMAVETGLVEGPAIVPCSRHVTTTGDFEDRGQWWRSVQPFNDGLRRLGANVFADGVDQIIKAVREEIVLGAEIIKLLPNGGHGFKWTHAYRGLNSAELRAAVNAAHERNVRVRAHLTTTASILECIEAGVDILDHCDYLDEECIEAMVERGTFFVPSAMFAKLVSPAARGARPDSNNSADIAWMNLVEMLPKAHKAGVKIVPGDDYGAQGMLHEPGVYARELQIYVDDFGISSEDVIRWATLNGAAMALRDDETGSIEAGKAADLLIMDGDPGSNIGMLTDPARYLVAIVKDGHFVKDQLHQRHHGQFAGRSAVA